VSEEFIGEPPKTDHRPNNYRLFHFMALYLVKWNVSPNEIACFGLVFSGAAGLCFMKAYSMNGLETQIHYNLLVVAAVCILLRLLCNMLDGMMSSELRQKSLNGELFSEIPDRLSDLSIFLGAGYFADQFWPGALNLAWGTCLLALLTAYIRTLGELLTGIRDFNGVMSKHHRMFIMAAAALTTQLETHFTLPHYAVVIALAIVALGSAGTSVYRLLRLNQRLNIKL
jgi:phosphatidylglycerophosphate synthase